MKIQPLNNLVDGADDGFTIIELMVATAIIGILSISLMTMMDQINNLLVLQEARSQGMVEKHVTAMTIESRLRRAVGPGLREDAAELGWGFRGHDESGGFEFGSTSQWQEGDGCSDNRDQLAFMFSDIEEFEVWTSDRRPIDVYASDAGNIIERCGVQLNQRAHEGQEGFKELVEDFDSVGDIQLGQDIDHLIIRYYDAEEEEWVNEWDGTEDGDQEHRLPAAVEYAFRSFDSTGRLDPSWHRGMVHINK